MGYKTSVFPFKPWVKATFLLNKMEKGRFTSLLVLWTKYFIYTFVPIRIKEVVFDFFTAKVN